MMLQPSTTVRGATCKLNVCCGRQHDMGHRRAVREFGEMTWPVLRANFARAFVVSRVFGPRFVYRLRFPFSLSLAACSFLLSLFF